MILNFREQWKPPSEIIARNKARVTSAFVDKPNIKNYGRRKVHLPECIGEQRKTHRYVSKILLYQLWFILFDISKFLLQEVSVLSRLKDHYYVYRRCSKLSICY